MTSTHRSTLLAAALLLLTPAVTRASEPARREWTLHGFRSPSTGLEVREGFLGFHVGFFPVILDEGADGSRTTWFLKTGVTAYFLEHELGSGRPSGPFASVSLVQGLNNARNVSESVEKGAGLHAELGYRWAAWRGLELRLGVGALAGDGEVKVHPTPGIGWTSTF